MTPTPHTGPSVPPIAWLFDQADDERPREPSPWRSFQWAYRDASDAMSPLLELHIRARLERELFSRRLLRSDPPELTVAFTLEPRRQADSLGALVVDVCDSRTRRRIWRGVAARPMGWRRATQSEIRDAVRSAMRGFMTTTDDDAAADWGFASPARYPLS